MSINASNTSVLVCCHKRIFNSKKSLQTHHFSNLFSNVGKARGTLNIFCIILVTSASCSILTLKFQEGRNPNCLNILIINCCYYAMHSFSNILLKSNSALFMFALWLFFFKFSRLPKKTCSAFLQLLHKLIQAMLREKYRGWKTQAKKNVTLKELNTDEKYQNGEKP